MKVTVRIADQTFDVEIDDIYAVPVVAMVDGQSFEIWPESSPAIPAVPAIESSSKPVASPRPTNGNSRHTDNGKAIYAPIPGVILEASVHPGDSVEAGQEVCVLEAMKMKQSIRAARAGIISTVHVTAGQHVKHHQLLAEFQD